MPSTTRYWIGVASRDLASKAVQGGFAQLGHGKAAPIKRLSPRDWIAYYSPRAHMRSGDPIRAFTAMGKVAAGDAYVVNQGPGFRPTRRDVQFRKRAKSAPIGPLLPQLKLTRGKDHWGLLFRRSAIEVSAADFRVIATAMGVTLRTLELRTGCA